MSPAEKKEILDKMKQHILLPDEEAVIAIIFNSTEMKQQDPFFAQAEDGDKVVFFVQARKVYIYSSEKDLIINAGPIYVDENKVKTAEQKISKKTKEFSIEIRNGGAVVGQAGSLADKLKNDSFDVIKVGDASLNDYQGVNIINLTHQDISDLSQELGKNQLLKDLPKGEKESQADVLIIIGQ